VIKIKIKNDIKKIQK